MAVTSRHRGRLCGLSSLSSVLVLVLALLVVIAQAELGSGGGGKDDDQKPIVSDPKNNDNDDAAGRQFPSLPVLGYVTPWNPRGKQLVEDYRHKFDIVSPVWYTIHAVGDGYEIQGAPPGPEDDEWYRRLQKPGGPGAKPLQVAPRFIVDGWGEDDYRQFIFNETRWQLLSDAVMGVVHDMAFDGVVFESGATHALPQSLARLSEALRGDGRILVVVMQPLRPLGDGSDGGLSGRKRAELIEATNSIILENLPQLSLVADYFSIMTYDMTGPGGREIGRAAISGESRLAQAAAEGNVREPGPNTSADWVRENLIAFIAATADASADQQQQQQQQQGFQASLEAQQASRRFLMGAPLYGYRYPVVYADGASGQLVEPTPVDPMPERPLITGAAAPKVRKKAPDGAVAILSRGGEAITAQEIVHIIRDNKPEAVRLEPEGEYYFDYEEKTGAGFFRVFLPTKDSIAHVLDTIRAVAEDEPVGPFGGAGVALWEVGQSSEGLLAAL